MIFLALCVLNLAIMVPLPGKFSYVLTEHGRLASGLVRLQTGDYSVFHVNPPLPDKVAAFPAFLTGTYCPTPADLGISRHFFRQEFRAGEVWVRKNENHLRWTIYGRYAMLIFVLLGIIAIYFFTRQSFGENAAILASLLWIFSPYILGHGCLVSPDVPSAALAVLSVFAFLKWLHRPTVFDAVLAGLALGLAELTKFTLLIFYPLFIVLWLLYRIPEYKTLGITGWINQAKQIFVMFAISLLVINMGYLFEGTGKRLGDFRFQTTFLSGVDALYEVPIGGGNRFQDSLLGYIPMPLPANMIQGIDTQRLDFERGMPSYLRGEWTERGGWWYYYLYALLIKTPFGTLGLLLLAIYCTFFIRQCNASWRDEMVILLPGVALLVFVSSQTGFSHHSRYIIPALPFFFIWISKVGKAISWKRPVFSTIAAVLLLWSIGSSLWVYPHNISYFNSLAAVLPTQKDSEYPKPPESPKDFSGRVKHLLDAGMLHAPRHLLNSNIDWGQDLFFLERWCRANPDVTEIRVAVWGSFPLESTAIPSAGMPPAGDPQPGWHAVSVNYIYDQSGQYRYFLHFEPVARAGYSIWIYHLTQDDVDWYERK